MTRASEIETAARKVLAHFGVSNAFNLFTTGTDVDALLAALDAPATDEPPAVVWHGLDELPPKLDGTGSDMFESVSLWLKIRADLEEEYAGGVAVDVARGHCFLECEGDLRCVPDVWNWDADYEVLAWGLYLKPAV